MSSIGICEYCKYIDKDITEKPCLHCSSNLGAFEFDISEHDAKVRADERAKIIDMLNSVCYDTHNNETRRIEHRVKAEIIELITRKHK